MRSIILGHSLDHLNHAAQTWPRQSTKSATVKHERKPNSTVAKRKWSQAPTDEILVKETKPSQLSVGPSSRGCKLTCPHLTSACEVALDVNMTLLAPLQKVQHTFLRRLLGLNPRSMCAFLFSETGLPPIAYRRINLALHYMLYIVGLTPGHLALCALKECQSLYAAGKPCWLGDLAIVVGCMPCQTPFFNPSVLTIDSIGKLIDDVKTSMEAHIDTSIQASTKGVLLCGRLEQNDEGALIHHSMHFHNYLYITIPEHCKTLTQLLLADHCLAEVQLRYAERHRPYVPHIWCLCRFCKNYVEDAPHALLACDGSEDLIALRRVFLETVFTLAPPLKGLLPSCTALHFFLHLMTFKSVLNCTAKYSHDVLLVYASKEMFVVDSAAYGAEGLTHPAAPTTHVINNMLW